jgi:hypothetical protein
MRASAKKGVGIGGIVPTQPDNFHLGFPLNYKSNYHLKG